MQSWVIEVSRLMAESHQGMRGCKETADSTVMLQHKDNLATNGAPLADRWHGRSPGMQEVNKAIELWFPVTCFNPITSRNRAADGCGEWDEVHNPAFLQGNCHIRHTRHQFDVCSKGSDNKRKKNPCAASRDWHCYQPVINTAAISLLPGTAGTVRKGKAGQTVLRSQNVARPAPFTFHLTQTSAVNRSRTYIFTQKQASC